MQQLNYKKGIDHEVELSELKNFLSSSRQSDQQETRGGNHLTSTDLYLTVLHENSRATKTTITSSSLSKGKNGNFSLPVGFSPCWVFLTRPRAVHTFFGRLGQWGWGQ